MCVIPVMGIGKVRVHMNLGGVPVRVRMLCTRGYRKIMSVLMMLVMRMLVAMLHSLMDVLMLVSLGQVQPEANRH